MNEGKFQKSYHNDVDVNDAILRHKIVPELLQCEIRKEMELLQVFADQLERTLRMKIIDRNDRMMSFLKHNNK
jgi:hypothetical protein